MKCEMEVLPQPTRLSSMNWFLDEGKPASRWTPAENKMFENALAVHDEDAPDRWHRVAALIPGKTVGDVIKHYRELEVDVSNIEAGLIPVPGYSNTAPFTLEWVNSHGFDGVFKQSFGLGGKRSSSARGPEQERKKGVPWTEEEHKLFLMGLKKYGKGDWRNISRNFVITRTPTQVASHAQKYFIRQLSGGKDKRRASIHDITTVNLNETRTPSPDSNRPPCSPDLLSALLPQPPNSSAISRTPSLWNQNQPNSGGGAVLPNATHGSNSFAASQVYGGNNYGLNKMPGQNHHYLGIQNLIFQQHYPRG
ncbi:transcription factor DIVARICATA-like [Punica granatum]|uniref:Uncharacterized protein n=2 Tax=Punica granatum TaxID=22663 RepID=A0A218W7I4_PUNGR|nr:transcription factor DIVARICATA-like [Punica granatum]OWM68755.1 hypothetical protein CDL15_Pgr024942 [Punica granatum]PKI66464.1 hypothetical protein CRG98_013120 [Punica granatum]